MTAARKSDPNAPPRNRVSRRVVEYVRAHPDAPRSEVERATGATKPTVLRWRRWVRAGSPGGDAASGKPAPAPPDAPPPRRGTGAPDAPTHDLDAEFPPPAPRPDPDPPAKATRGDEPPRKPAAAAQVRRWEIRL